MKVKKKSGRKFDPWESLAISFMKVKKRGRKFDLWES